MFVPPEEGLGEFLYNVMQNGCCVTVAVGVIVNVGVTVNVGLVTEVDVKVKVGVIVKVEVLLYVGEIVDVDVIIPVSVIVYVGVIVAVLLWMIQEPVYEMGPCSGRIDWCGNAAAIRRSTQISINT